MASTNVVQQTSFLSLPPEIRNRIYDDHLIIYGARHDKITCHRIHDEAEGIFFAANHLKVVVRDVVAIRCIFGMMGTVRCESVRRLTVTFDEEEFDPYDGDPQSIVSRFAWELKRLEGLGLLQIKMDCIFYKKVVDKLLGDLWGVAIALANLIDVGIEWGTVFEELDESSLVWYGSKEPVPLEANLQGMLVEGEGARARWAAGDYDETRHDSVELRPR